MLRMNVYIRPAHKMEQINHAFLFSRAAVAAFHCLPTLTEANAIEQVMVEWSY